MDRDFNVLVDRNTWEYAQMYPDMSLFKFTWVFKMSTLDEEGTLFTEKVRCCVRGDQLLE